MRPSKWNAHSSRCVGGCRAMGARADRVRHQAGLGHRTPHEVYAAALVA